MQHKRDLLTLLQLTQEEITQIIHESFAEKSRVKRGEGYVPVLAGRAVFTIYEKPSTRTRASFNRAASLLGITVIESTREHMQLSRGETLKDTALVLSRYVDAIAARVLHHSTLEELAHHAAIPVINLLSDKYHPLQALADVMTILEYFPNRKVKVAFIGDGSANTCHSLMIACASLGMDFTVGCPPEYAPDSQVIAAARVRARKQGCTVEVVESPAEAVHMADVIYTDTWFSMGVKDIEKRREAFPPYQVNSELLAHASEDAIVLHCQPWFLGQEITADVAYSPRSKAFEQAENRLYTSMAVLKFLLAGGASHT
ncbi:MAG: ornithine carbamoyltransferase [Thermoproteota archaeon]|nr:MAG: ornithine carbamoyltransferase [Candidatus Korarchaeota archaeon]RLG55556.1 MAG: ornithine carbamoyltransferase [Candidatus Korarchaeota archaeon]